MRSRIRRVDLSQVGFFAMTPTEKPEPPTHEALQLARAAAIETYSYLEQQLCLLFADLMHTDYRLASIVFYRLTNTHSRNRIIESLLEQRYGKTYRKFWNSVLKLVRQIDTRRNELVHWHVWSPDPDDETDDYGPVLAPHGDSEASAICVPDLNEFIEKTEFVRLQIMMFYLLHLSKKSPETLESDPSYETFLRPVTYPPPADYPGFHLRPAPSSPPQS
jgi:hypothetical protein